MRNVGNVLTPLPQAQNAFNSRASSTILPNPAGITAVMLCKVLHEDIIVPLLCNK